MVWHSRYVVVWYGKVRLGMFFDDITGYRVI